MFKQDMILQNKINQDKIQIIGLNNMRQECRVLNLQNRGNYHLDFNTLQTEYDIIDEGLFNVVRE